MKLNQEIFAIKLYEMEQEYGTLQSRLHICGGEDHEKIRQELQKAKDEYKEQSLLLQKRIEGSRSKAVSELAAAQLEYSRKTEALLRNQVAKDLHSEVNSVREDEAEAAALYAEYALDFATQAMKYALLASLTAIDLQMGAEEQEEA